MRIEHMKAAVLRHYSDDRPYSVSKPLSIEEVSLVRAPQAGEVLIKIRAAGLCHSDLSVINGSRPRPLPMVLGHEAAGEVMEVGAGVTTVHPGDHVVVTLPSCGQCAQCNAGRVVLCNDAIKHNTAGELLGGKRYLHDVQGELNHHLGISAFAEYAVVSAQSLLRIDTSIPLDIAAVFGCSVVTGMGAMLNKAQVQPGSSVLIVGLGGVGLAALMGAVAAGASTIVAADIHPDKLITAKELGATHTLLIDETAQEQLRAICPEGVEVAADFTGVASALEFAFLATSRGGKTVSGGLPDPSARISLSPTVLVAEERQILGSYLGSNVPVEDIARYMAWYQEGRLPIEKLITHRLAFEEINEGFERLAKGESIRQIILFD